MSTTHSLLNSTGGNLLYDYVIMDEASQIDIISGALALFSAKKCVIVGDLMQLPHVVPDWIKHETDQVFQNYDLDVAYRYAENSMLSSVTKLFPDVARTLLKEHYRCHPKIIGFCNQKFYDNELVILTSDKIADPEPIVAVEAVIHSMMAPLLLGGDPDPIEEYWHTLFACINFSGYGGAEMRALSAIDIALWDIKGQACGKPISSLLGGKVRERIPVYNTCVNSGHFQDMDGFLQRPGPLARELLSEGITAMKIFPWDRYAPKISINNSSMAGSMGMPGTCLSPSQLREGLKVVDDIRNAVGRERRQIPCSGKTPL